MIWILIVIFIDKCIVIEIVFVKYVCEMWRVN